MCNDSKTDVVKLSNEEGKWSHMSEDSSQKEEAQFFVMFTPSSEAQAQRASQEPSTVCEDSEEELRQLVTQRETSTRSPRLDENTTVSGAHGSARARRQAPVEVVDGRQGPSSRQTASPKVLPDQERRPYTHHAAGESTLIEQGRSTARSFVVREVS